MHTPHWALDRPTASPCSVVGFVTPPHRAAAGGPSEAEDGRGGPGQALWEVKCLSVYIVETNTMPTISLSLAKPGEAMPGPYSSLMVLTPGDAGVPRASRSGPGRGPRGGKWRTTPAPL